MEYNNAPIAEVVVGAQFDGPIFDNQKIFNFYQEVSETFPLIRENQVLPAVIENLNGQIGTKFLSNFNSRKFFINKIGSKLIQLQPDKLLFNWKKTDVGEEYPNFSVVFEEFMKHYESLKGESDIDSRINQVEVTYLDHILLEDFEIKDFNTGAILNVLNFENRPINHFKVEYSIPVEDLRGNIRVSIHSAKRNNDLKNIIVLESTCRGALGKNSISEWFDTAHKRLTNLFDNLSTDKAKEIWEGQK